MKFVCLTTMTMAGLLLLSQQSASAASSAVPVVHNCPAAGSSLILESLIYDPTSPATSTTTPVSLATTDNVGEVCILSIANPQAQKPVARSYDGRNWEISSGSFAGIVSEPSCVDDDASGGGGVVCTLTLPTDIDTLGENGEYKYLLTSYYHHQHSREAEVARFLEQTTFGATRATINELSATSSSDGSSPDFEAWIEFQLNPSPATGAGLSSHREFFRSRTNPRFEYPFRGAVAGPKSACERTSRWRKFALTERDGIVDYKSGVSKWLTIQRVGSRYVWYVEGMARTSTATLGHIVDHKGRKIRNLGQANYRISDGHYLQDNMKYSCVGCPVHICAGWGCGFIENPKVDLSGIINTNLQLYPLVDLPPILAGGDGDDDGQEMVPIDDGPYLKILEPYQQPNDEFWLNATIPQNQCQHHPNTTVPIPSLLTTVNHAYHVESASPPIFGRTTNAQTGEVEFMLFDPIFQWRENTVENPLVDGGGNLYQESDEKVFCANVPRSYLNEDGCKLSLDPMTCSTDEDGTVKVGPGAVVCGSPGEVASDFRHGVIDGFDVKTMTSALYNRDIYKDGTYTAQKDHIWYHLALTAGDQLRQRMAWALYQIVPISAPKGFVPYTEQWLVYYDIFVNNAFGCYRDVLKQVSFTDLMADWLSFTGNTAIQHRIDNDAGLHYPDENYAREIMQLFSIGTVQLNMDGTKKIDANGGEILTYDSTDIMNYARAWTGFQKAAWRGNIDESYRRFSSNRLDPMTISRDLRDVFPKSDLSGGYIGDGYPLCVDLPDKDFLRKGAVYRLLGSRTSPELQWDEKDWESSGARLGLQQSSPLYTKLCAPDAQGSCTFPGKVVLDENLFYDATAQAGAEYQADTLRSVRVQSTPIPIFYEYVRPPCVHQAFFGDGKKIIADLIYADKVVSDSMCADPRTILAADGCCPLNWATSTRSAGATAIRNCLYNGERMRYNSAVARCSANDRELCFPKKWDSADVCFDRTTYSWTPSGCKVRVKISFEEFHDVARVDYPDADWAGQRKVKNSLSDATINFFKVPWNDMADSIPSDQASCDNLSYCYSVVDGCICDTNVVETSAFTSWSEITSKDDVLKLRVGAFPPDMHDAGEYVSLGDCGISGLEIYSKGVGSCTTLDSETIFSVTDVYGVGRYVKNIISNVEIVGIDGLTFRNPTHFVDFADKSLRDMYQETEAVIDSYFYHPTHPPFLALRILQRFGISNPSPKYIERVAAAYKTGSYLGRFGSGEYGDLGALIAAALLDPEARSVSLDADPAHGHIREPTIKITSFLRSMQTTIFAPLSAPFFNDHLTALGQTPYRVPSVFSFFLPEYSPAGAVGDAGLVSPETSVLDNRALKLLNGFWSTTKFGLSTCHGGFADRSFGGRCLRQDGLTNEDALGKLDFDMDPTSTVDDVLHELSLLLTSSRMSEANRALVKSVVEEEWQIGDKAKAIRMAQQLIAAAPEFHTTNRALPTGIPRQASGYTVEPKHSYKAVVFFMMTGGADSFNLLVPKADCTGKDMYQEYAKARQGVALPKTQLLDIDATGSNQICNTFGVNNNFPLLQKLYAEKDALFFANTGVLTKPLTKHDDWSRESKIQLFAHNHMQEENYGIDPLKQTPGTGVGGRMLDLLRRQGYHTSSNMVDGSFKFSKGHSADGNPTWNVATLPIKEMDVGSSVGPTMLDIVKQLNGEGDIGNSLYGETWSSRVSQCLHEYEQDLEMQSLMESGEIDMSAYPFAKGVGARLRAAAQYMKTRAIRKVDRDVFIVTHEGYDHHSENGVGVNFEEANDALHNFVDEMKREDLWNDVVIVMGSDFGRSITTNSNGGTDHAWGGNYFMMGGDVKGGRILGEYPQDLSEKSLQWIMRGRMIPTTGWDAIWNGVANWFGVRGDKDLDFLLPNRGNFDKCSLYTDEDLFDNSQVPHTVSCTMTDGDGDGVPDDLDQCPDTGYMYLDQVDAVGCAEGDVTQFPTTPSPVTPVPTAAPVTSAPTGPGQTAAPVTISPTKSPTPGPSPSPTKDPTPSPTAFPTTAAPVTQAPTPTPIDFSPSGTALVKNVLSSGSSCVHVGGTGSNGAPEPERAFDGTTDKFLNILDGSMDPGVECTPAFPSSVVTGIRIYTGNDGKSRDPASFILEGREDGESSWLLISQGNLNLPDDRNPQAIVINSTVTAPDMSLYHQEVTFDNVFIYSQYRVTFPELKNSISSILQFAEIELPGYFVDAQTTTAPPTNSPSKSPTRSPTSSPVYSPTVVDAFTAVKNVLDPNSVSYLVGSTYPTWTAKAAYDGTTDKAGIPLDVYSNENGGFVVVPSSASIVKGIRLYTANNYQNWDPSSYVLEGRNGDGDTWRLISQGPLILPIKRNALGITIDSNFESADSSLHHQEILFGNEMTYLEYKITFPTTFGDDSSIHISEVELPGYLVPDGPLATPSPTAYPTKNPSFAPATASPTKGPTPAPVTDSPTKNPTSAPVTSSPTKSPTPAPVTASPTKSPTPAPVTASPTKSPTPAPVTASPTKSPTPAPVSASPTTSPTKNPTFAPATASPTKNPTPAPVTGSPTSATPVAPEPSPSPTTSVPTTTAKGTSPVSTVLSTGSSCLYLGGTGTNINQTPETVFDGTTNKYLVEKDGSMNPGAQCTPAWPSSVVTGIRIYTGNDGIARDPASYVLEGSNDGSSWQLISQGDLNLPGDRNAQGIVINSSPSEPDLSLYHQEITFGNTIVYSQYRVTFPELKNSLSTILQVAEIELPGYFVGMTDGPTLSPTAVPSKSPTPSPTVAPPPLPSGTPVGTVLSTASTCLYVGGSGSKAHHTPAPMFDGTTNKYPVFKDGTMAPGAQCTPEWPSTVVTGIRIYTANDGIGRDPASYVLEGSNDGISWQLISQGDLNLPGNRNAQGKVISSSPSQPDLSLHHQEVTFGNTIVYSQYRITFPETKTISSTIMQVAEVELPGILV